MTYTLKLNVPILIILPNPSRTNTEVEENLIYVGEGSQVHEEHNVGEEEGAHLHHDEEQHDHDAGGNNENERWAWIHTEQQRQGIELSGLRNDVLRGNRISEENNQMLRSMMQHFHLQAGCFFYMKVNTCVLSFLDKPTSCFIVDNSPMRKAQVASLEQINQNGAEANLIVKEASLDHGGKDTPSLTSYEKERIFDGLSLGAKERGFGADSEQKYEDSETKICLPQVRSLAWPVLTLARPCHLPGQPFAAFT
ncbi:hypothetical protein MTR_2g461420 [Medicago truncatula]|uniref:Uncharacterized protein n=1 Tax=Medicago truncatula TaxID=3880 RepID=A0A072V8E4_MEDTR|nr:hypothetical protein MTR_2g461420 [Medicago truncatula]